MRPEREVLVGGAAGGSKTDYLCIEALFHFNDTKLPDQEEGHHTLIVRETLSSMKKAGSIWHRILSWINNSGLHKQCDVNRVEMKMQNQKKRCNNRFLQHRIRRRSRRQKWKT